MFHSNQKCEKIYIELDILLFFLKNVSSVYSHQYAKIKINVDDYLLLEKTTNINNVVMLIESVFNENHS